MSGIYLLGSGGWIPTSERATCSALVRQDDEALLLDAGTGIARLVERPDLLHGVNRIHLLLTHFHLDHVVGLAYVPTLDIAPLNIHGPGQALYGTSTKQVLKALLGYPLLSATFSSIAKEVDELKQGMAQIGRFRVYSRFQHRHSAPTLAFRIDEELTYCTDTAYDEGNISFASEAALLMHEAWYPTGQPQDRHFHSSGREAGEIARQASVDRLFLIHVNPQGDEAALVDDARIAFPDTAVGSDLLTIA